VRLFWTLLVKEARSVVRDRQNLVGVASLAVTLAFVLWTVEQTAPPGDSATGLLGSDEVQTVRLVVLVIAQSLSAYASFFAIPLALATFVGEKESQTLELLLAAPIPDARLYVFKVLSITILGAGFGLLLLVAFLGWAGVAHGAALARLPSGELALLVLAALPLPLLYTLVQVGLGACVSVRADSMKGAGQLLGGLYMLGFAGCGGVMIALGKSRDQGLLLIDTVNELSFWPYYLTTFVGSGVLALLFLVVGGLLFRRERLIR